MAFEAKKEIFCQGKALGKSHKDLSRELDITEKTASSWGKDPKIQARIKELLEENWIESQSILLTFQKEAARTLVCLMTSKNEAIKLRAASTLLSLCASFPEYL